MKRTPHNPNELIAIVDEKDNTIGEDTRKNVHEKGYIHRETYCYIINSKKRVLLQKRKDNSKYDPSCAGHFPTNQTYKDAIKRECQEELGIRLKEDKFEEITKDTFVNSKGNKIIVTLFLVQKNILIDEIKFDKNEVEEVKYFDLKQLKKILEDKDKITSICVYFLEKYIIPMLSYEITKK